MDIAWGERGVKRKPSSENWEIEFEWELGR